MLVHFPANEYFKYSGNFASYCFIIWPFYYEYLIVTQLVNEFLAVMQSEYSVYCARQPGLNPVIRVLNPTIHAHSPLILSSHLRLGYRSDLFLSAISTNILYAFFTFPICTAYPTHLIVFVSSP